MLAFVGLIALMSFAPVLEASLLGSQASWAQPLMEGIRGFHQVAIQLLMVVWFFALGSMIGSFINVVVWRMPRGVSVISQGSACPFCTTKIRLVDNIPVFGWLKLGGRCRACRLPISPRYPLVEALFGAVFLILFLPKWYQAVATFLGGIRAPQPESCP